MKVTKEALERVADRRVTGYVVRITPDMAKAWLAANTINRKIRPRRVDDWARVMSGGDWQVTHQGICFARDGTLIDGQHRLHAIVSSGVSVSMLVFADWDRAAFANIDTGLKRTIRDVLRRDSRAVETCVMLVRLAWDMSKNVPQASDVNTMLEVFHDDIAAMMSAAGGTATIRTVAGIRAAVVLRHRIASPSGRRYILDQWRAWVQADWPKTSTSVARLSRRLESISAQGQARQVEQAATAWIAFNPDARDLQRILVNDVSKQIDEMRDAVRRIADNLVEQVATEWLGFSPAEDHEAKEA